ncbi:hypothetical protein OIY81_1628 [Cryptosporidium canis]|uniref:Uncharacterized protein n=1 Tax=Cryptosporidium canis TaxID=195482 RepID=A0ABQ8P969_9CRYT|nr:hypothetical protein OIY81_1628 [Cryptosporidium canis]KAJ1613177.1 hypothetical protein OJ252_1070 [Cryptosporidium canis]
MNKFEDGLEHVRTRISRIEDEIYTLSESRDGMVQESRDLEDKISSISVIENILTDLYDELHRVSEFHEANSALIINGFEVELRKIYVNYHSVKLNSLISLDFLEFGRIYQAYKKSRNSLIIKLKGSSGGDFIYFGALENLIKLLIKSSRSAYSSIFNTESIYRIMQCFIYIDLLIWDPFSSSNDSILPSFSAMINVMSSPNEVHLNDDLLVRNELIEMLYSEKLMDYMLDIIRLYWTPIYLEETENLIKSISYFRDYLQLELSPIVSELILGLERSFSSLISEYLPRPDFEYKLALLILNWSVSVLLIKREFHVQHEHFATLNRMVANSFQTIVRDSRDQSLRELFCSTEFDIGEINKSHEHLSEANSNAIDQIETAGLQSFSPKSIS